MNEEEKKVVEDYKSKLDLYKYEKEIGCRKDHRNNRSYR